MKKNCQKILIIFRSAKKTWGFASHEALLNYEKLMAWSFSNHIVSHSLSQTYFTERYGVQDIIVGGKELSLQQ